jgi:hypothetical protein
MNSLTPRQITALDTIGQRLTVDGAEALAADTPPAVPATNRTAAALTQSSHARSATGGANSYTIPLLVQPCDLQEAPCFTHCH